MFAPEALLDRTADQLAEFFRREIEVGIDGTDIKAGIIKIATRTNELTVPEERALRAAARVSQGTGIAIQTQTHARLRAGEKYPAALLARALSDIFACCVN